MAERSEKQYGFFLRFANMTFIPCEKCQKVLDDLVKENYFEINAPYEGSTSVYLSSGMEGKYSFELLFLIPKRQRGQSIMNVLFVPCDDCQTTLVKLLDEADLILGNVAYIPYIEFWRHPKVRKTR